MSKKIQAVIFDLYNTLIYTKNQTYPYPRLFNELYLKPNDLRKARRIALTEEFNSLSELVEKIKPNARIDVKPYEDDLARELDSIKLYSETKKVLKKLKKRGFKMGLISNLASPYKRPFFDLGLDEYIDNTLFSCEVGLKKPNLKLYGRILNRMHLEPKQALMVGDNYHCDVLPPKNIGMKAILLDRFNQHDIKPNINSLEGIFQYC